MRRAKHIPSVAGEEEPGEAHSHARQSTTRPFPMCHDRIISSTYCSILFAWEEKRRNGSDVSMMRGGGRRENIAALRRRLFVCTWWVVFVWYGMDD